VDRHHHRVVAVGREQVTRFHAGHRTHEGEVAGSP
jgi:hypothetical protein